jgi:hypothetical protein
MLVYLFMISIRFVIINFSTIYDIIFVIHYLSSYMRNFDPSACMVYHSIYSVRQPRQATRIT